MRTSFSYENICLLDTSTRQASSDCIAFIFGLFTSGYYAVKRLTNSDWKRSCHVIYFSDFFFKSFLFAKQFVVILSVMNSFGKLKSFTNVYGLSYIVYLLSVQCFFLKTCFSAPKLLFQDWYVANERAVCKMIPELINMVIKTR